MTRPNFTETIYLKFSGERPPETHLNQGTSRILGDGTDGLINSNLRYLEMIGEGVRIFPKNHLLLDSGCVPEYCYLVQKGQVLGIALSPSMEEQIYYVMDPGALFLEANVIFRKPVGVSFRTSMLSELIPIRRDRLIEAIEESPRVLYSVLGNISGKFFEAMDEIRESKSYNANWHLCKLLLSLAERYGVAYDGKVLIQRKTGIQFLTSMLGVNRATTVRGLRQLRNLGLIENINGYYCVRSMEALRRHQEMLGRMGR